MCYSKHIEKKKQGYIPDRDSIIVTVLITGLLHIIHRVLIEEAFYDFKK